MTKDSKDSIISVLVFFAGYLLWLFSTYLIGGLIVKLFGLNAVLFILPITRAFFLAISIWLAMRWGRGILASFILLLTVVAMAVPLIIPFFGAINYRGEGIGGAIFIAGSIFIDLIYLAINFVAIMVLLLHCVFTRAKSKKSHLFAIGTLVVLMLAFDGYQYYNIRSFNKSFCTGESGGLYNDVFFLQPITKYQVSDLLKRSELEIEGLLLAPPELEKEGAALSFEPPMTAQSAFQPLEPQLPAFWSKGEYEVLTTSTRTAIAAYEEGRPVVWAINLADAPMMDVIRFVYDLDVNKHLLGIYVHVESDGRRERDIYYYTDPTEIVPQTATEKVWQAKCYKYLNKK